MAVKHLQFYEISDNAPYQQSELTEIEKHVFDVLNTLGAANIRAIRNQLPDYGIPELDTTLQKLIDKEYIVRRTGSFGD
jgi:predicted component of type VI protein secretion system